MKGKVASVVAVIAIVVLASRVFNTWGYIGGALQPGGGGRVAKREQLDPADVTPEQVAGRWLRHRNPKAADEVMHFHPNGQFEWWTAENGEVPDGEVPERGTWELADGSIYLTRNGRTCWLGHVVDMGPREAGRKPRWLNLMMSKNGACEQYDRLETSPATTAPPTAVVPRQMPAPDGQEVPTPFPPGLPVADPKPLPTVGPKPLPTTEPK